jgi:hypothetical protein
MEGTRALERELSQLAAAAPEMTARDYFKPVWLATRCGLGTIRAPKAGIGRRFSVVLSGRDFYFTIYQTQCVWLISSCPFGTIHGLVADDGKSGPAPGNHSVCWSPVRPQ